MSELTVVPFFRVGAGPCDFPNVRNDSILAALL